MAHTVMDLHITVPTQRIKLSNGTRGMDVEMSEDFDLGDVLGEFRLLVAVSGILFGFLLNISVTTTHISTSNLISIVALSLSAMSVLAFLLPVIYHHTHVFPLTVQQKKKMYVRSHRFAIWGIGTLVLSIYFSLVLALHLQLGTLAYLVSTLILAFPLVLFVTRKVSFQNKPIQNNLGLPLVKIVRTREG